MGLTGREELGPTYGEVPELEEEGLGLSAVFVDNVQEAMCRLQGMNNLLHALQNNRNDFFYWQNLSANNWRRAFCISFISVWGFIVPTTMGLFYMLPSSVHLQIRRINDRYFNIASNVITAVPLSLATTFIWAVPTLMLRNKWEGWRHFLSATVPNHWRTYAAVSIIGCSIDLFDQDEVQNRITNYIMGDDDDYATEEDCEEDLALAIMQFVSKKEGRALKRKWARTGAWALTGLITASILVPVQVVMICVLSGEERYNTIPRCINQLWQEGGIAAFYRASAVLWAQYWCLGTLGSIWN